MPRKKKRSEFHSGALCALLLVENADGVGSTLYNEMVHSFGVDQLIAAAEVDNPEQLPGLRAFKRERSTTPSTRKC